MSDNYLLPHLKDEIDEFYNIEAKKLRPEYEWYVDYLISQQRISNHQYREAKYILNTLEKKMNRQQLQKLKADSTQ